MKQRAMTMTYEVGEHLYINVTNKCPCDCTFCLRQNGDGAYGSDPLWLEHDPSFDEMTEDLKKRDLTSYSEIVFCGYGEPLMRLRFVCEIASWIRAQYPNAVIRLNTNGLVDRYLPQEAEADGTDAAEKIAAVINKVSVSLNGGDAEVYCRVTRPSGNHDGAYETMLHFAKRCKELGMDVLFTVVSVISQEEIAQAQAVADGLGIELRVREYIAD